MFQILYKSECLIPEDQLETEIQKILKSASVNNRRDKITGLFLLVENRFLQLMEGDEEGVKKCMSRIQADARHTDLKILIQRPIEKRLFPKWSMHYFRLTPDAALEQLGVDRLKDLKITNWKKDFKDNLAVLLLESFARLGSKFSGEPSL